MRREAHVERQLRQPHGISHGRSHVQMRARKSALRGGKTPFVQRDGPPHQLELVEPCADRRHCIGHQSHSVGSFGGKCGAYGNRIDVRPVDDDACGQTRFRKGRADDAGLATGPDPDKPLHLSNVTRTL